MTNEQEEDGISPSQVLIAPDKFKGSLTAREVATALTNGLHAARPGQSVRIVPIADGGDGTLDAALALGFTPVQVAVHGPTDQLLEARIAVRDGIAIIESAVACGLSRLPGGRLAPLVATSFWVGELVSAALDVGCRTVVLGVGGSASTDGGAGMLQALGARITDTHGEPLAHGGGLLENIAAINLSTIDSRLAETEIVLACDVDNPLLGSTGAAHTFGAQKGADSAQIAQLELGLAHWAELLGLATGRDQTNESGAGGGIGFGALVGLSAIRCSGIDLMLKLVGFADLLIDAKLVITGEGTLDEQTLRSKAIAGIANAAEKVDVPVVAVVGRCLLTSTQLAGVGIAAVYPLTECEPEVNRSMSNAAQLVQAAAKRIAQDWLPPY